MNDFPRWACCALALLVVSGCASHRVRPAATTIGKEVSFFQADLSKFQDALKRSQQDEQVRILGTSARRDSAAAATRHLQVEWALAAARTNNEVLAILQTQGREEITRLTAASAPPLPGTSRMPVEKLGDVAATLDKMSEAPGKKADLDFLLGFAKNVNEQLKSLDQKARADAEAAAKAAKSQPPK
jgi:hypothetical protein